MNRHIDYDKMKMRGEMTWLTVLSLKQVVFIVDWFFSASHGMN